MSTIHDTGSIVYIPMENKFGEFDDTGYETDEEFLKDIIPIFPIPTHPNSYQIRH